MPHVEKMPILAMQLAALNRRKRDMYPFSSWEIMRIKLRRRQER
jgi:hypothetical protein